MRSVAWLCGWLAFGASPLWAVDYSKIDRSLAKEPAYQSKSPQYALLLFGPQAKLRVWVVLDGETLYVDRNADGDLTGKEERFEKEADCKNVEIRDRDGKTRYVITSLGIHKETEPPRSSLMANVDIKSPLEYRQYCDAGMAAERGKASVAHFHGPLGVGPRTINWKLPPGTALTTGEKPTDLYVMVGTMDGKSGCWVVVRTHEGESSAFAKDVFPKVEVEFPPREAGGPPVKRQYWLDQFC